MYMSTQAQCLQRAEEAIGSLRAGVVDDCELLMCVQGTVLGSSGRSSSALYCRAISPALVDPL